MTLIQKLILKFKKLFSKKGSIEQEKLLIQKEENVEQSKVGNDLMGAYFPKDRQNALKFQDECNTELWLRGNDQ